MRKSILSVLGLAAMMSGLSTSANNAKKAINEVSSKYEQRPNQEKIYGGFYDPQPIFIPTKSQKIKNKINRKRLGINK